MPVKNLDLSKTRLHIPGRRDMVLAMLHDTLCTLLAADAGPITVVSPDPRVALLARTVGVDLLHTGAALNAAISAAVRPGVCAAVLPDLPALRVSDIEQLVEHTDSFVPDAAGTGTTMAIAAALDPVFGRGSARRFQDQGLRRLEAAPTARTDVDTAQDLALCARLGVGKHTAALLAAATGPCLPDRSR